VPRIVDEVRQERPEPTRASAAAPRVPEGEKPRASHVQRVPGPSAMPVASASAASVTPSPIEQELRIARAQVEHKLYEQALGTLRAAVAGNTNSPAAVDAYFLMASIQETEEKPEDAMATYIQIADRFQDQPRAPEALFRLAQSTLRSRRSGKEADACKVLTTLVDRYRRGPWVGRALMFKADLEGRQQLSQYDDELRASVPTALVTYRRVAQRDGENPEREAALWKLGQLYEEVKRFDLAVQTYAALAERYPNTTYDVWASVAKIYDRRLKNPELARAAYARVPPSSPHFKDAQKHASKP